MKAQTRHLEDQSCSSIQESSNCNCSRLLCRSPYQEQEDEKGISAEQTAGRESVRCTKRHANDAGQLTETLLCCIEVFMDLSIIDEKYFVQKEIFAIHSALSSAQNTESERAL